MHRELFTHKYASYIFSWNSLCIFLFPFDKKIKLWECCEVLRNAKLKEEVVEVVVEGEEEDVEKEEMK